ncbi:MAG: hypothetical protein ABIJ96_00845 [Elusimicrobiota bacterium]
MGLLAIIAGSAAAFGVFMYVIPALRRRVRANDFEKSLVRVSFNREEPTAELLNSFHGLDLFAAGDAKKILHLARGERRGVQMLLFDLDFWQSSLHRGARHSIVTVAAFQTEFAGLPMIHARPRNYVFDQWDSEFLDFPEDEDFEKAYLVSSEQGAIREFFNRRVRAHLRRSSTLVLQARGEWVILFRNDVTIPPNKVAHFLDQAALIFSAVA